MYINKLYYLLRTKFSLIDLLRSNIIVCLVCINTINSLESDYSFKLLFTTFKQLFLYLRLS